MATLQIDPHDVPERAIVAFEELAGVMVTVHDLDGTLWPYLAPARLRHRGPLCDAIKYGPRGDACIAFETGSLRENLADWKDGRVQVCHAGLVETVVPTFHDGRPQWVFFAGQRMPSVELRWLVRDPQPATRPAWPRKLNLPAKIDDTGAQRLLEGLRQLASRLQHWAQQHQDAIESDSATRAVIIRRFIQDRHRSPVQIADLAAELKISRTRAVHLVRECCGRNFQQMLTEARLATAAAFLRFTVWPVSDVALRSGWRDVSRFHRVFRATLGCSPRRYRIAREGGAATEPSTLLIS